MKNRHNMTTDIISACVVILLTVTGLGCNQKSTDVSMVDTLLLGAYTVPKDVYQKEIIPAFQAEWKKRTGRTVIFQESYVGSGAQARAIIGGFEADIAALSLEGDIAKIQNQGLITHDWRNGSYHGFITNSVVVIAMREDIPFKIEDWEDLTGDSVEIICANPKTSGGAQWFINSIYGAGLKKSQAQTGRADPEYAMDLLRGIYSRIKVMDKSARASMTTFERGVGHVILTYENEVLLRKMQGRAIPFIIPDATILIENPVAVIDVHADKHGVREVADAFVEFLYTDTAQRAFAEYGFRPVSKPIADEFKKTYPQPEFLFDISYLGGWPTVNKEIFGANGIWARLSREVRKDRR